MLEIEFYKPILEIGIITYVIVFLVTFFTGVFIKGLKGNPPDMELFEYSAIWPVYMISFLGLFIRGMILTVISRFEKDNTENKKRSVNEQP